MGFDSALSEVLHFIYRAELEEGLVEYEYDHVLVGLFDGVPQPDPDEVAEWKWVNPATLGADLKNHPESYTYWFRISFDRVIQAIVPVHTNLSADAASPPTNI
jgi:isopentenyl-diphosphate delta-isomerase